MKKIIFGIAVFACLGAFASADTKKQVLTYNTSSEPQSLDPATATTVIDNNLLTQVFEGLVALHPKKKYVPGVAERWTASEDKMVYTFYLRKNAKWSDGTPVTAYDFEYAWRRTADPKTAAPFASKFDYIKNGKEVTTGKLPKEKLGAKAINANTFQVELAAPHPPFLQMIVKPLFAPVKKDVVEKFGDTWTRPENIVSNGPFLLTEWKFHEYLTLKKNPNYWDKDAVKLEEAKALIVDDEQTALKKYHAGESEFEMHLPQSQLIALQKNPEFYQDQSFGYYYYPVNTQHPILKDARIRKALALAIDREVITKKVMRTGELPAYGFVPPGVEGYPYKKLLSYDPKKARELLAEAGYPGGKGLAAIELSYNNREIHKMIAEAVQQMWKKELGVEVTLVNREWKTHINVLNSRDFQIIRLGSSGDYNYPDAFLRGFVTGDTDNYAQWSNAQYDALWKVALMEPDAKKRLQTYGKMEVLLAEEVPFIPFYFYINNWLVKPYVEGMELTSLSEYALKYVSIR